MRIRSIRPEFWRSEDIARLDHTVRLIFIGLWSYVDDNGAGRDDERLVVADLLAFDDPRESLASVRRALAQLSAGGQIVRYEVAGRAFLRIVAWEKHQKIDRPSPQRYPLPTCDDAIIRDVLASDSRALDEGSSPGEGEKGRRGEGLEETCPAVPDGRAPRPRTSTSFDKFWAIYPRKQAKATALKAWTKAVRAAGGPGPITDGAQRLRDDPNREDAFTPMPATWLNAERWDDGPLPSRSGSSRPTQTQQAMGWIDLMNRYPDDPKELTA